MLVKPVNSTGTLSISDAPVTLGDIPKTIADSYGIANNFSGESILDSTSSDERTRLFYEYDWMNDDWDKQYLPPMTEYQINGFSWDPASWKPSYRVFTPSGVEYTPPIPYQPGTIIHFGTGEDAEQYLGSGWSYPGERLDMDRRSPFDSYSPDEHTPIRSDTHSPVLPIFGEEYTGPSATEYPGQWSSRCELHHF